MKDIVKFFSIMILVTLVCISVSTVNAQCCNGTSCQQQQQYGLFHRHVVVQTPTTTVEKTTTVTATPLPAAPAVVVQTPAASVEVYTNRPVATAVGNWWINLPHPIIERIVERRAVRRARWGF